MDGHFLNQVNTLEFDIDQLCEIVQTPHHLVDILTPILSTNGAPQKIDFHN